MNSTEIKQKQRLDFLIQILLKETDYKIKIPDNLKEKHWIYKSLCNMRHPLKLSDNFFKIEKEYLQERLKQSKITNVKDIPPLMITHKFLSGKQKIKNLEKICLWKGDITKLEIDSIVNAGNSDGLGCFDPTHVCIDNQIHSEAGAGLRIECYEYMKKKKDNKLNDGEAMITKAYNLPCKNVIQTVGPCIEQGYSPDEQNKKDLGLCYTNCLKLLISQKLYSIAFPAISTGLYGFPKKLAAKIALKKIDEFIDGLNEEDKDKIKVVINVYDEQNLKVYEDVLNE